MRWFQNGDRNTRFFHNYVKERRKKLYLVNIQTTQCDAVNTSENIGVEAISFFEEQFREHDKFGDDDMLHLIPKLILHDQNEEMGKMSTIEEVRMVVFALNGGSTSILDDFSDLFFQSCWELIGRDITRMVEAFFCGQQIPRFISYTNLVLSPKK